MMFDRPTPPSWTKQEFEIVRYPIPRRMIDGYTIAALFAMTGIALIAFGSLIKVVMS